jgi:hypothetical protein
VSLKLQNFTIQRNSNPLIIFAGVVNEKNENATVQIHLQPHHNVDDMTIRQLEELAIQEARRFSQG